MVDKIHIENFLKLNGLTTEDTEEAIRAALEAARWPLEDIEETFRVLAGQASAEKTETVVLRQLFTSDLHVDPTALSELLGVKVPGKKEMPRKKIEKTKWRVSVVIAYSLSACVLVGGAIFLFYGVSNLFAVTAP